MFPNPFVAIFAMGTILHLFSICIRATTKFCPYSNRSGSVRKTAIEPYKRVDEYKKKIYALKEAKEKNNKVMLNLTERITELENMVN